MLPERNRLLKPDDIPQDIWNAAVEAVATAYDEGEATITVARALLARQEHCALIAQNWQPKPMPPTEIRGPWRTWEVSDAIAASIRKDAE